MAKKQTVSALLLGQLALGSIARAQTAPVTAGRPAYVRLGVGTAHDIYGYYPCTRLSAEFAPMLSRKIGLASRVVGIVGKPSSGLETQLPNQNYRAGYLEQEVVFYPFGNDHRVNVGLGAGGFFGYYRRNSNSYLRGVNGQVTEYELASQKGFHGGGLLSLNVDVALGEKQQWRVGGKATLQNGISGNTRSSTYSLTLGRRL
ncbi:hypothetical protein [Hymenobacter swuensis]|uniref:Outer membrane protein beta-barrel domain-containing protein n=1 Tax=Hymenobacter swuensis DY53 TaxID=1227739 RepID=W8F836_9BACT|nr:hypothetical protein [Hymenobacter swuensis]AHJ97885.1 hypothetical protein Hsw_2290 [Hymenobacter swuensis DY53]